MTRFSIATYAIDSAIIGSTTRAGSETTPYIVKPSVIECASVNALTCARMDRHRELNKKIPITKRMLIEPLGHDMGEAEDEILPRNRARRERRRRRGERLRIADAAPLEPDDPRRRVPNTDIQGVGAEHQPVRDG